jgi:cell division protein ZapA
MEDRGVVHVDIFGSQYTIKQGSEDSDYIVRVAAYVDQKMREINEKLPVASVAKVAVLTSLNLADELFKEREGKDARRPRARPPGEELAPPRGAARRRRVAQALVAAPRSLLDSFKAAAVLVGIRRS